jgi:bacillithiol biosynthesis deacetylase BshB1
VEILAIAAHRDDVEQTCGGTLLKMAQMGRTTAILDLSRGEMGTRGTMDDRAREAEDARQILRVAWRKALDIPDGRVENTFENRQKVAAVIRELRPRVLILPYWQGRHPDHYTAGVLGYEAAFVAGLAKLDLGFPAHRPFKIVYASLYVDVRPTFFVDITDQFETRLQASGSGLFPREAEIREKLSNMAGFYGLLAGVKYAEPFVQKEVGLIDDLLTIPVQSI